MDKLNFDDYPITEEEIISILGTDYKIQGDELVFACNGCRASGNDKSGDNLKFNRTKHVLKCFAGCGFDTEIVGIIARRRMLNAPKPIQQKTAKITKTKEIPEHLLNTYYYNCHITLMKDKDLLRKMWNKHTILPRTAVECLIGYDAMRGKLVFPSQAIGTNPTTYTDIVPNGAEYREIEGEKIVRRISGYEPKICAIYHHVVNAKTGIICEGYKDAYNLLQLIKIQNPQIIDTLAIFTVQNGTNSINTNNCLQKVNWNLFDEIAIVMDNDEAGDKATQVATSLFPRINDWRQKILGNSNDIQTVFKETYAHNIDIEQALKAEWLHEYDNEELIKL